MYGWDSYFIIRGLVGMAESIWPAAWWRISSSRLDALRQRPQRQPHLLPHALAAAVSHLDDSRRLRSRKKPRPRGSRLARQRGRDAMPSTINSGSLGDTSRATPASRAISISAKALRPKASRTKPGTIAKVAAYFLSHPELDHDYLLPPRRGAPPNRTIGPAFSGAGVRSRREIAATRLRTRRDVALSADYYKADRSMRESGFDISFRFGPYGARDPSLRARLPEQPAVQKREGSRGDVGDLGTREASGHFREAAEARKKQIQKYLWDEQRGMFFDYNFVTQERFHVRLPHNFLSALGWPRHAEQARAVDANLKFFEQPGGLAMSRNESGVQWDYPYDWAPTI